MCAITGEEVTSVRTQCMHGRWEEEEQFHNDTNARHIKGRVGTAFVLQQTPRSIVPKRSGRHQSCVLTLHMPPQLRCRDEAKYRTNSQSEQSIKNIFSTQVISECILKFLCDLNVSGNDRLVSVQFLNHFFQEIRS